MSEYELMRALEKVDRDTLWHGQWLLKNLSEIKGHHLHIRHIMTRDSYMRLSEDEIESVARLLSTLMQITDSRKKKEGKNDVERV